MTPEEALALALDETEGEWRGCGSASWMAKRVWPAMEARLHAAGVRVTGDAGLREALLNWFDTTHANGFGHDHHCPAPWSDEPYSQPIFDRCTCGWSDVQRADQARAALATGDLCQHGIPASECRIVGCGA